MRKQGHFLHEVKFSSSPLRPAAIIFAFFRLLPASMSVFLLLRIWYEVFLWLISSFISSFPSSRESCHAASYAVEIVDLPLPPDIVSFSLDAPQAVGRRIIPPHISLLSPYAIRCRFISRVSLSIFTPCCVAAPCLSRWCYIHTIAAYASLLISLQLYYVMIYYIAAAAAAISAFLFLFLLRHLRFHCHIYFLSFDAALPMMPFSILSMMTFRWCYFDIFFFIFFFSLFIFLPFVLWLFLRCQLSLIMITPSTMPDYFRRCQPFFIELYHCRRLPSSGDTSIIDFIWATRLPPPLLRLFHSAFIRISFLLLFFSLWFCQPAFHFLRWLFHIIFIIGCYYASW